MKNYKQFINESITPQDIKYVVELVSLIAFSLWSAKRQLSLLDDSLTKVKIDKKVNNWFYKIKDKENYAEYEKYIAGLKQTLSKINKQELKGLYEKYVNMKNDALIGSEQNMTDKIAKYKAMNKVINNYIEKNISKWDDINELYMIIKNDELPKYNPKEKYGDDRNMKKALYQKEIGEID